MNPTQPTLATKEKVQPGPGRTAKGMRRLATGASKTSHRSGKQLTINVNEEHEAFIDNARRELAPGKSLREFLISLIEFHRATISAPSASSSIANLEERLANLEAKSVETVAVIAGLEQSVQSGRQSQIALGTQLLQRLDETAERQDQLTAMMDQVKKVLIEALEADGYRVKIFNDFNQSLQRLLSANARAPSPPAEATPNWRPVAGTSGNRAPAKPIGK